METLRERDRGQSCHVRQLVKVTAPRANQSSLTSTPIAAAPSPAEEEEGAPSRSCAWPCSSSSWSEEEDPPRSSSPLPGLPLASDIFEICVGEGRGKG